jgi:hypothetical protein
MSRSRVSRIRRKFRLAFARLGAIIGIPKVPTNLDDAIAWNAELTISRVE